METFMRVTEWLDCRAAEGGNIESLHIPHSMLVNDDPDEIVYFKDINECGLFCQENHPYAKVARYGHWFHVSGQDKRAGKHSGQFMFEMVTRDRSKALQVAREHIE